MDTGRVKTVEGKEQDDRTRIRPSRIWAGEPPALWEALGE